MADCFALNRSHLFPLAFVNTPSLVTNTITPTSPQTALCFWEDVEKTGGCFWEKGMWAFYAQEGSPSFLSCLFDVQGGTELTTA